MKLFVIPVFLFTVSSLLFSCKKELADGEVSSELKNPSEFHNQVAILDKVKLLSTKKNFTSNDVVQMFPHAKIEKGGKYFVLVLIDKNEKILFESVSKEANKK